jgi:RsiW-degrading membrane proteinase PrsW (M82 family)
MWIEIIVSLFPVFMFLSALILMDSFRLITRRSVIQAILIGGILATICLSFSTWIVNETEINWQTNVRYLAPLVEEICKALFIIYLLQKNKAGFMVDAAIYGFAVGAGFACVENIFYLQIKPHITLLGWIIRGLGTAVMHGGTCAIFAIISKNLINRFEVPRIFLYSPGLIAAIVIHSFFNHFFLNPVLMTVLQLILLPIIIWVVFMRSEENLRNWLEVGMDNDVQLLEYITGGRFASTRTGAYLQKLKENFPGEIVADMLCYIRIHLELAVRAKGVLLMQESGFKVQIDIDIKDKFSELNFLEKSIGRTGKLALSPIFRKSTRDLWQLYFLNTK